VGDESVLAVECAKQGLNLKDPRVSIVHAPETIGMAEPGAKTVRRKKQSSINIAMEMVKEGRQRHLFPLATPEQPWPRPR
jgi:phosphate acyltransferase